MKTDRINYLPEAFYLQDTLQVAKGLLGKLLVRIIDEKAIAGHITETEAYIGRCDKASHAYGYKKTPRTDVMFRQGGCAYVYFVYGMYHCLNVVAEQEGEPCAVLVRGLDIIEGLDLAAYNRYTLNVSQLSSQKKKNISNGPGKLCKALKIDKSFNGASLCGGELFIAQSFGGLQAMDMESMENEIKTGTRIGIDYAEEAVQFPWRFYV